MWMFAAVPCPLSILVRPVQEKFPRPLKFEYTLAARRQGQIILLTQQKLTNENGRVA